MESAQLGDEHLMVLKTIIRFLNFNFCFLRGIKKRLSLCTFCMIMGQPVCKCFQRLPVSSANCSTQNSQRVLATSDKSLNICRRVANNIYCTVAPYKKFATEMPTPSNTL
jgi:hypothetical protein